MATVARAVMAVLVAMVSQVMTQRLRALTVRLAATVVLVEPVAMAVLRAATERPMVPMARVATVVLPVLVAMGSVEPTGRITPTESIWPVVPDPTVEPVAMAGLVVLVLALRKVVLTLSARMVARAAMGATVVLVPMARRSPLMAPRAVTVATVALAVPVD